MLNILQSSIRLRIGGGRQEGKGKWGGEEGREKLEGQKRKGKVMRFTRTQNSKWLVLVIHQLFASMEHLPLKSSTVHSHA